MISAIIKKASQDEQQNQATITTSINYIQIFMSIFFLKKAKLISKVKIASDKIETEQKQLPTHLKKYGTTPLNAC